MVPDVVESLSRFAGSVVRTILVVEDEDIIRFCLGEFLRDCGYHVLEAAGVAAAKDVLARRRVDLVFSDVNMGNGETGFALERWLRRHHPYVKVLLTSGLPQRADDTGGLSEPVIPKPYCYDALVRRIERLLDDRVPAVAAG